MTDRLAYLEKDANGHPIPWHMDTEGRPSGRQMARAVKEKRCWICGEPTGRYLCFGLTVDEALVRASSVPGSHYGCIEAVAAGRIPTLFWPQIGVIWSCSGFTPHPLAERMAFTLEPWTSLEWVSVGGAVPGAAACVEALNAAAEPVMQMLTEKGEEKGQEALMQMVLLLNGTIRLDPSHPTDAAREQATAPATLDEGARASSIGGTPALSGEAAHAAAHDAIRASDAAT